MGAWSYCVHSQDAERVEARTQHTSFFLSFGDPSLWDVTVHIQVALSRYASLVNLNPVKLIVKINPHGILGSVQQFRHLSCFCTGNVQNPL